MQKKLMNGALVVRTILLMLALLPLGAFINGQEVQKDGGLVYQPELSVFTGTTDNGDFKSLQNGSTALLQCPTILNEIIARRKIQNVVSLKLKESSLIYIPNNFTAKLNVQITYGPGGGDVINQVLEINYTKEEGAKYKAKQYLAFEDKTDVTVTIGDFEPDGYPTFSGFDIRDILIVENSMVVTRYFNLSSPNLDPASFSAASPVGAAFVGWTWPVGAGNNYTQLEWAYASYSMMDYYYKSGTSEVDYDKLFLENSTRIDLPVNIGTYSIRHSFDSYGLLYIRVRAVNLTPGGREDGKWSEVIYRPVYGHDDYRNWQVRTTYSEEGKSVSTFNYFDGTLRGRQSLVYDNVDQTTSVSETMYDPQGRPAVQVLPSSTFVPGFTQNLNMFDGQGDEESPVDFFDLEPIAVPLSTSSPKGAAFYYSPGNSGDGGNALPDAEGYAYTLTRYTPDNTGRILSQSGVGPAFKAGGGHETRYYYGTAAQEELDGLFGTDAGNSKHYFKNMVKDANGQLSVSYVDMHGRTVATALAGNAPGNLLPVNYTDQDMYYNQGGTPMNRNLLDPATNVVKGNSIESINTLLVPVKEIYTFNYALTPQTLQSAACENAEEPFICHDCLYDLEISIIADDCESSPVVKKYSNVSFSQGTACDGIYPGLKDLETNIVSNNITIPVELEIGSYTIRKTLTVNEASLQRYRELWLEQKECESFEQIRQDIYTAMLAESDCDDPSPATECEKCEAQLGDYVTVYRPAYLNSIGHVGEVPTALENEIAAAYHSAQLVCQELCNPGTQILTSRRELMLADMTPGGQYAKLPSLENSVTNPMHRLYDIFSTQNVSRAKAAFRLPLNESDGLPGYYYDVNGDPDEDIHPAGVTPAKLDVIGGDEFADLFKPEWANSLLRYHPEYARLKFAEDNLSSTYTWIADFNKTQTYLEAQTAGYFAPYNVDAFYSVSGTSAEKTQMTGWVASDYQQGLSLWQIARGMVKCKGIATDGDRQVCYAAGGQKIPPFSDVTSTEEKDEMWLVFRNLYSGLREQQMSAFIAAQRPLSDQVLLVQNGYTIRFNNNITLGALPGADFIPSSPGGTAPNVPSSIPGSAADPYLPSGCDAHVAEWQKILLDCPTIAGAPNSAQIISEIIDGMLTVCEKGLDLNNPYGASTVPPSTPQDGSPRSFEEVVREVFETYSIPVTALCNPYLFSFPLPYGGPVLAPEPPSGSDDCICTKFAPIRDAAIAAGFQPDNISSLNEYFQAIYGQTVSQDVFDALQDCDGEERSSVPSEPLALPLFLQCDESSSACISCARLSSLILEFKEEFSSPENSAPYLSSPLTEDGIKYNTLLARFLNVRTGNNFTWAEYLGAADAAECSLEALMQNVGDESSAFPALLSVSSRTGNTPLEYVATSVVEFLPGFESSSNDLFTAYIIQGEPATQTVLCPRPPEWQNNGDIFTPPVCQRIFEMADALATQIFEQRRKTLLADFEQRYRAKCLEATEGFTVSYTSHEYHYTLYYYDMAGNLVKTVPPKGVKPEFGAVFLEDVKTAREDDDFLRPGHTLVTNYRYNSLGQVVAQESPDGGHSQFWYDNLGRLVISQNAEQAYNNDYSYTRYDALGRIIEVGQKPSTTAMTQVISQDPEDLDTWLMSVNDREQLTVTKYDYPYGGDLSDPVVVLQGGFDQENMRGRVSYTYTKNSSAASDYHSASFYTYDIHGNVDVLLQDYRGISAMAGNTFRRMAYDYDLISGKVNEVAYQPDFFNGVTWTINPDKFFHRYKYDSKNRLTEVYTSRDRISWDRDAAYEYYLHGPLKRTVLGDQNVQGLDYAYTLQGWLKGVNSTTVGDGVNDLGGDGLAFGLNINVARDVFGFALHYYDDNSNMPDYKPIGSVSPFPRPGAGANMLSLYNGNIAAMSVNIAALEKGGSGVNAEPLLYRYQYDQLHRIKGMTAFNGLSGNIWTPIELSNSRYRESVEYDPNGNILSYDRNGSGAALMDQLTYHYDNNTNRLNYVDDAVSQSNYGGKDIQPQEADNYTYDRIGNMKSDEEGGVKDIRWTVYGKISEIHKNTSGTPSIVYTYDAAGNRISKTITAANKTTVYVRDASGNVMSVYEQPSSSLEQTEIHLYGSSRLGLAANQENGPNSVTSSGFTGILYTLTRGEKVFELSNHLGNVLATVSDRKIQVESSGAVAYYKADVKSASDYYPFGMQMLGRTYSAGGYRYGFNGKENDNEVKGEGNQQDYGFRIYDPRLGKFLSVDPLTKEYPWYTPYQFAGNKPISFIDRDGLEEASPQCVGCTNYTQPGNTPVSIPKEATDITLSTGNEQPSAWRYKNVSKKQLKEIKIGEALMKQMVPAGTLLSFNLDGSSYNAEFSYEGNAWAFNGYYTNDGKPYIVDEERGTVGKPGTGESLIPVWGSGRDALYNFQKGNIWAGLGYSALAVSDVFLVKSLFQGVAKGGFKAMSLGNKSWSGGNGYRKFYLESGFAKPGEPLHHWLIHQNGSIGKYVPNAIKNQMWNLKPFSTQAEHMIFGHGKNYLGQPGASFFGQVWHGIPTWPKLFTLSYGGRGIGFTIGAND